MIILVGSKIAQSAIQTSLGKPEYSYFFLLKSFMPALERLGQVISVTSTEEVDEQYALHKAAGRDVVFLSFSPPHQTPVDLKCPTICVFAWEFCSIPLASDRTRMLLADDCEEDARYDWGYVFSRIAGAIATSCEAAALVSAHASLPVAAIPAPIWGLFEDQHGCAECGRRLTLQGEVIDSRKLKLDPEGVIRHPESEAVRITRAMWRGWCHEIRLPMLRPGAAAEAPPRQKPSSVDFDGVVYTSVLNPKDGRKKWVEMMTAFCWAFRDVEDATLVLKMTHHDIEQYRGTVLNQLSRLMPFRCRVVVLHGFLDEAQYRQLIEVSDYYVNASSGEGLCLPLMEFLCGGRPAVAPMHTAMADYLRTEYCFPVATSSEPDCWPHDPTGRLLTFSRRLNWQSLVEAFRDSYPQAGNREKYLAASRAAKAFMKNFCAPEVVAAQMAELIERACQGNAASQVGGGLQA
jgi:hypothetical protein